MNRERVEKRQAEPTESTSYKEATTVTDDENDPIPGPPQESGTSRPHD